MCGVFGYVGNRTDVGDAVVAALRSLEYRGYDSWGVALATHDGLVVDKETGRINGNHRRYPKSMLGLGHTRWATHGGVTAANAHPHLDCSRRIAVVHNGIIENHSELREYLMARGHRFSSETDSEVVAHLVEVELTAGQNLAAAVAGTFALLEGYNAIVVMDSEEKRFAATKNVSPLIIGLGGTGTSVASDAIALDGHADRLIYLEDNQLALLAADQAEVLDRRTLQPARPFTVAAPRSRTDVGLNGHENYLSKEVSEQPDTLRRLVKQGRSEVEALAAAIRSARKVIFTGCGTAGNAALAGAYLFGKICGRDVMFVPASEFNYRAGPLDSLSLVVALSQSGETVDVLDAVGAAKRRGSLLAAIVNSPNSTLDRAVDVRVHLRAGIEQCVLATKSYTAMLAALLLTASQLDNNWPAGADAVERAADAIEEMLHDATRSQIREIGDRLTSHAHLFVIGRGEHYPSALESALKIKEVSYIHAEGFAAGELKHGVIALIEPGTPCLVLAPNDATRTDVLLGASELRSRGARIIGVGSSFDPVFDEFVAIPDAGVANVIVEAVPGQLLGYFAALARGHDPDRPRNLAKSVTVK
ncbi:MAG: glutamine--fructose-6-phosphate transaminase (isomerizing) [Thermomicrobiales bacterium]